MAKTDFQFAHPLRVRFAEVDAHGQVFNSHYLTYFDSAITDYMRAFQGTELDPIKPADTAFFVARTVVEYKAPIGFDETIEVHVRIARLGRSSVVFRLEIHPQAEDRLLAAGEVVWVHVDSRSRQAVPLPATWRQRVIAREGEQVVLPL